MSKKKRKPQVIHVKKVIIKADEVIIEDHGKKHRDEDHGKKHRDEKPERRDPWGFFGSEASEVVESDDKEKKDDDETSEEENDRPEGGFSWF